ncbi:uncharacterized protein J4E87_007708 [Alternaria ethzedia]|uniref:uncharacterized protein n=1 Tax=Alternaria ethzedia TaxID=181014 RepID=UPI0020C482F7|nr:uncharacterized protein J4E87_007708 [Alternaria ethzedia]KAI4619121.1 hypothetical protein J4E87_007708 [Alternaria ethzedia]
MLKSAALSRNARSRARSLRKALEAMSDARESGLIEVIDCARGVDPKECAFVVEDSGCVRRVFKQGPQSPQASYEIGGLLDWLAIEKEFSRLI